MQTTSECLANSKGRDHTIVVPCLLWVMERISRIKLVWKEPSPSSECGIKDPRPLGKLLYFSRPLRRGFHKLSWQLVPPA